MNDQNIPAWVYYYGGFITILPIAMALTGLYDHLLFFPFLEGMPFEQTIGGVVGPYLVRNFAQGVITGFCLFYMKSPSMFMGMLALRVFTDVMDFGIVILSGTVTGWLYVPIFLAFLLVLWGPTVICFLKLRSLGYGRSN